MMSGVAEGAKRVAVVVNVNVQLVAEDDPFGQVLGGRLCIKGPVWKGLARNRTVELEVAALLVCWLRADEDMTGRSSDVCCVPLFLQDVGFAGLVLERAEGKGEWSRMGTFRMTVSATQGANLEQTSSILEEEEYVEFDAIVNHYAIIVV
jgi:hypothetical protein